MSKIIKFNRQAKETLAAGAEKVFKAVATTMGPYGRNVLIEKEYGQVASTKDGVTVAKSITLEDPIENMGATVIKQAAQKTVDIAGDGTTTSTVLAYNIASNALLLSANSSVNVTEVKKGIEEAVKDIVAELKKRSVDITDENQIKQIATLSANGDEEIGNLVSSAMEKVGRDGVVTVERSRSGETSLEVVEGLQFDRGYKSPYFVTDNNSMSAILNEPYILIYDKRISVIKDLLPILERIASENKSLLIIAEDVDGEALGTLVLNKARGALNVCAVRAPEIGDRRANVLEDIAILTGGTVISPDRGMNLAKFDMNWLGKARLVSVNKDTTTIVDGKGVVEEIEKRIYSIKAQMEKPGISPYEIEKFQERLGKMVGGVAIINVGGNNEIEMEERKDRIDDALQATKAAIEEGILPGAGVALLQARKVLNLTEKNDKTKGKEIVFMACASPFKQILENAGEDPQDWWYKIAYGVNSTIVPDIANKDVTDAYSSGIIDPTKVVRSALQNAAAAAITLLMTECVIHEKVEDKKKDSFGMSEFGI